MRYLFDVGLNYFFEGFIDRKVSNVFEALGRVALVNFLNLAQDACLVDYFHKLLVCFEVLGVWIVVKHVRSNDICEVSHVIIIN